MIPGAVQSGNEDIENRRVLNPPSKGDEMEALNQHLDDTSRSPDRKMSH